MKFSVEWENCKISYFGDLIKNNDLALGSKSLRKKMYDHKESGVHMAHNLKTG